MVTIIVPKVIVPVDLDQPLIFLAGPIRGGGDWQCSMANQIIDHDASVQIACPSRWDAAHPLSHYFHHPFTEAPNRQLHWERHYLKLASMHEEQLGCVLFWLGLESKEDPHPGPEPYAMDTRREIGKFTVYLELKQARVVVGGHPDFYGLSVIKDELDDAAGRELPFYTSMEDLSIAALRACV